jgi:hypothetical protein
MSRAAYDADFYAWTQQQAAALRAKDFAALDLEHLAEEIESLGKRDRRAIFSQLERLLLHLLKWAYQPLAHERYGASWRASIRQARRVIADLIEESPSLRDAPAERLAAAYRRARERASEQTFIPVHSFPETCPWPIERVLDPNFWPEAGR